VEAAFKLKDGSQVIGALSAKVITLQGIPHMISVTRDITERKQTEEALKQNYAEIERVNNVTVGREVRMVELKREVNTLLKAVGQPEKYRIAG